MKLFTIKSTPTNNSATIYHLTDMEGSPAFFSFIKYSNVVTYDPVRGLDFNKTIKNPYFIYSGDVSDHGNCDLAITKCLVDFKQRYPDRVILIAGNREIIKNRFKIELDPELIRERLLHTLPPRWLSKSKQSLPIEYVIKDMRTKNIAVNSEDKEAIQKYVDTLSISQCQLIYLHWMLEKTMGCPNTFQFRRDELAKTAKTPVTDETVLQSFLYETSPSGITGTYLKLAQVLAMIPNTGVITMHGGLNSNNIGRLPTMSSEDKSIEDAQTWVNEYNKWYQEQIKLWENYKPTTITEPAFSKLDDISLPLLNKPKSVMVGNALDQNEQYTDIPLAVDEYCRKNNIRIILTGHQQCGDHPAIVRGKNILWINGNTMPIERQTTVPNEDAPRGAMCHNLEISANKRQADIKIDATLPDHTKTTTHFIMKDSQIVGDVFIGHVLPDHHLVQFQLPDGNYRLLELKGKEGSYSTLSANELAQFLNENNIVQNKKLTA